jgi:hypothetical protein
LLVCFTHNITTTLDTFIVPSLDEDPVKMKFEIEN